MPLLLGLAVFLITFFNRWIFVYHFEPEYWENYYYESQWNIPNSPRVISDEGVYRYIGYRLVNGENPFNVDYWVPPLGKYLYGLSAQYLSNPYITSFVFYLLSIFIFFKICSLLFLPNLRWPLTLLFAINPLIVEQISQTMLDLPLTVFFLLHLYFLLQIPKTTRPFRPLFLSAISLGLMAGTKPPYFIPFIALLDFVYLYYHLRSKIILLFPPFIFAGYVLAYFCYFIYHPNPIPWLRLHDKIIAFHRQSSHAYNWPQIFIPIFTGHYTGFWVGAQRFFVTTWSAILPLGLLATFYQFFKSRSLITLLSLLYLTLLFLIDFWPRYLVPLLPLLVFQIGLLLRPRPKLIYILILLTLPSTFLLLFPSPTSLLTNFSHHQSQGFYRESYRLLDTTTRSKIPEPDWIILSQTSTPSTSLFAPVKENNHWYLRYQP